MLTEINKILVGALQQCDTRDLVEDTFIRFNISNYSPRTAHLVEAMGNPKLFFSDGSIDIKCRYATVLSMFLTGEWKMNTLYDKAGL
ncbi:MAG: hypothetical protein FWC19_03220 [Treponema sp.]|nr:hypothetical protein [Treponema sp.]MCL2271801.1 hypothetical protein [Treponema sp.]